MENYKEIYTSINKMNGGFLVSRANEDETEQKIITDLDEAIAWIKEVLV